MSLINDALKRATSLGKKNSAHTPDGLPPLELVQDKKGKAQGGIILVAALLVVLLGYVAWSQFGIGKPEPVLAASHNKNTNKTAQANTSATSSKSKPDNAVAATSGSASNPLARAADIAASIRAKNEEGSKAAAEVAATTPSPATGKIDAPIKSEAVTSAASAKPGTPAESVPTEADQTGSSANNIAPAASDFPSVQLQAIYYRTKKPAAVLNGKTIREGDEINGLKVAQIARDQILLEYNGHSKTLSF